jgi:hypothetical protein
MVLSQHYEQWSRVLVQDSRILGWLLFGCQHKSASDAAFSERSRQFFCRLPDVVSCCYQVQFLKLDLDVNLGLLEAKPVPLGSSLMLGFGFLLPRADPP